MKNAASMSLGAAMRGVNVCKAKPLSRNFVLADHVDSTRCLPGSVCQIDLSGVPNRDSRGRIAHVRGIFIAAQAEVTLGATNEAVSAYDLRGLFGSIELTDSTGWKYFDTLDGRTILDDQYFRAGSMLQYPVLRYGAQGAFVPAQTSDNGIPVNDGAGDATFGVSLYMPLHNPRSGNPSEGLIPLALIQDLGALRFSVQSVIPGAPTGVTFNELQYIDGTDNPGLDVWLDVVYLDGAVVDAPWQLSCYTMTNDSGMLRYPGRETEYCWLRYFTEDTFGANPPISGNGQSLAQSMEGLTLSVAGFQVFGGFRNVDAVLRMRWFTGTDIDGSWLDNNASRDLPVMTSGAVPLALLLMPWRPRGHGPAGGIEIKAQSRTPSAFRFVHRTVTCHDAGRAEKISRAVGLKAGCACVGTNAKGEQTANINSTNPILVY
jgi:hypothetical protein